jgi:hypothetical protein
LQLAGVTLPDIEARLAELPHDLGLGGADNLFEPRLHAELRIAHRREAYE